jgi:hypothetical protein
MVTIRNVRALHHAIGLHIVEHAGLIAGAEFRFLRKQMGLSQREPASLMRTSDQTVVTTRRAAPSRGPPMRSCAFPICSASCRKKSCPWA